MGTPGKLYQRVLELYVDISYRYRIGTQEQYVPARRYGHVPRHIP